MTKPSKSCVHCGQDAQRLNEIARMENIGVRIFPSAKSCSANKQTGVHEFAFAHERLAQERRQIEEVRRS